MLNKFDIFLFSLLLFLYIIINNTDIYFIIVYIQLALYYAYKLYRYIRFDSKKNMTYKIIKSIIISGLHFLFSYFVIYEPNPLYYMFTFYLPFQNFFKSIFILIFHSYLMERFTESEKCKENQLINSSEQVNNVQIWDSDIYPPKKTDYFLSEFIYSLKTSKTKLIYFVYGLLIIKIFMIYYNTKMWIYFKEKKNVLPISTERNTKYYITACVLNMEKIIIDYISEMKKLINFLGEKNIIFSIVENGDSKDNTREYLKEFKKYLDSKDIPNKFVLTHETEDPRDKKNLTKLEKNYGRIKYLATLRNRCFDFLYQIPNLNFNNLQVINFNDVVFSYEDVIKLLSTNKEDYDAVCAMDYYFNFYDNWVSIDLDGYRLLNDFPYFINIESQEQYINKKPIRIFSCWNGIISFNASVLKNKNLEFRVEPLFDENKEKEKYQLKTSIDANYESECTNFNIDMEALGFTKRFINPEIRVAYGYLYYYYAKYILPNTFEILFYFKNYIKSFNEKRNKNMSNTKDKNVTLSPTLKNWFIYRKVK